VLHVDRGPTQTVTMFPGPPEPPSAEVSGLAIAAYGVLEVRDAEADVSDWDGERRMLPLELDSGRVIVMQLTAGPAVEWNVPGGPGRFSVDVRFRNREMAARRSAELSTRMVDESWSIDRSLREARVHAGLEEYQIDLYRL
jgi:hypothetical protein